MVADETEARARRAASLELQAALARQTDEIALREGEVERELAAAEPALLEAQVRGAMERKGRVTCPLLDRADVSVPLSPLSCPAPPLQTAVRGIKRQHLDELRSMSAPPAPVKLTLEAVLVLLGSDPSELDWAEVRSFLVLVCRLPQLAMRTSSLSPAWSSLPLLHTHACPTSYPPSMGPLPRSLQVRRELKAGDFIQTVVNCKTESLAPRARALVAGEAATGRTRVEEGEGQGRMRAPRPAT